MNRSQVLGSASQPSRADLVAAEENGGVNSGSCEVRRAQFLRVRPALLLT